MGSFLPISSALADDNQNLVIVSKKLGNVKRASFDVYGEARFGEDVTRLVGYMFGPRMKLPLKRWFSINAAINSFNLRRGESFANSLRYDLGLNFKFKMGGAWRFEQRFQSEFFDWNRTSDFPRYRARSHVTRPLSGDRLTGWYSNAEWFYEPEGNGFTQFRLIPVGLKIALSEKVNLNAHYLLMDFRGRNQNHVLVTSFQF